MSDGSDMSGLDEELMCPSRADVNAAVPEFCDTAFCMCCYRTAVEAYKKKAPPEAKGQRTAPPLFQVLCVSKADSKRCEQCKKRKDLCERASHSFKPRKSLEPEIATDLVSQYVVGRFFKFNLATRYSSDPKNSNPADEESFSSYDQESLEWQAANEVVISEPQRALGFDQQKKSED
ncbi:hypothetical protein LQW54_000493 [Pestalotiopsis sp. IQ-011]